MFEVLTSDEFPEKEPSTTQESKGSWELTVEAYARHGIDIRNRPMDKTIRRLTREEWLKSGEEAYIEHHRILRVPEVSGDGK